jgi:hypothetical protein
MTRDGMCTGLLYARTITDAAIGRPLQHQRLYCS